MPSPRSISNHTLFEELRRGFDDLWVADEQGVIGPHQKTRLGMFERGFRHTHNTVIIAA